MVSVRKVRPLVGDDKGKLLFLHTKRHINPRPEDPKYERGAHCFALKNILRKQNGKGQLFAQPPPAQQGMQRQNSHAGGPDGTQHRNHPVGDGGGRAPATAAGHGIAAAFRGRDHLGAGGCRVVKGVQIVMIDLDVSGIAARPL